MEVAQEVKVEFLVMARVLVRGKIISRIKHEVFLRELKIDIEEDKGILKSTYKIIVRGEKNKLEEFKKIIETWSEESRKKWARII